MGETRQLLNVHVGGRNVSWVTHLLLSRCAAQKRFHRMQLLGRRTGGGGWGWTGGGGGVLLRNCLKTTKNDNQPFSGQLDREDLGSASRSVGLGQEKGLAG